MDSPRDLRFLAAAVLAFGLAIALALTANGRAADTPVVPPSAWSASHDQLQADADMTQLMSVPAAGTAAAVHQQDGQLERSQRPGYLDALEQHQGEVDRMLARPAR